MSDNKRVYLRSILTLQCPACHNSSIFNHPKTYQLKDIGGTKKVCDLCGENLNPEPGFFFGASYVAYGLVVALWLTVLLALKTLDAVGLLEFGFLTHPKTFLITGFIVNVIVFPYLLRLSRSIWAHLFIKERE